MAAQLDPRTERHHGLLILLAISGSEKVFAMATILQPILNFIYRQRLMDLMHLCVCFGLVFHTLRDRFSRQRLWSLCCRLILVAWFCAVLCITIFMREPSSVSEIQWIPLMTYWQYLLNANADLPRSAFMNMLLFFPGGLFFAELTAHRSQSPRAIVTRLLIFGLFSAGIELTQGLLQLGTAEIDDVLHNVLGAAAGFAVFQNKLNTQK